MPAYRTVTDATAALHAGEVTAVQLVDGALARADALDDELGVFLDRYSDAARVAAAAADADLAAGRDLGPLHGIPLGIKDIISTADGPTTAQSLVLDPQWGEQTGDAVVISRLRDAGAILVGKTTTMEYALGPPDPDKPFPIPRNPWDRKAWAGGSSSGTGSGVATGMFLAGLGTDTGGSIRIPSAYCGITGLKPTFGRVPKSGCFPLGFTLDHIGPMARSARDCAVLLGVIAGYDASDPYAADQPVDDYVGALTGELSGLRIGVDRLTKASAGAIDPAQPDRFEAALAVLADAGARVVDVKLPYYAEMCTVDMLAMVTEAMAIHRSDLRARWSDYGAGTRYLIGTSVFYTAADYVQAQRVRRVGQLALADLFTSVDLVVTPTSTQGAPSLESLYPVWGRAGYAGLHTTYWSASGSPTASVPIGFTEAGLPLAMQISGRPWAEGTVLAAADAFQQRTDFHLRSPS
ncbi:MAG TPA: amidase [Mycobacteriales bacterium]|jgi:aspartyl-tRNA(Asn)/glutamyl-tRNA(Gln) amidotransferase subunit A|nr:amidase [Mycobacteriales bacterium]